MSHRKASMIDETDPFTMSGLSIGLMKTGRDVEKKDASNSAESNIGGPLAGVNHNIDVIIQTSKRSSIQCQPTQSCTCSRLMSYQLIQLGTSYILWIMWPWLSCGDDAALRHSVRRCRVYGSMVVGYVVVRTIAAAYRSREDCL